MNSVRVLSCAVVLSAALACALALATADGGVTARSDALANYVARPDKSTAWRQVDSGTIGTAEYVEYLLTSQTWRGIEWKHQLFVIRPSNMARDERHALLFVHGGRWKPEYEGERGRKQLPSEAMLFARLAESIGAPVGVLRQVPFSPMFDRTEDALIAYTFDQYLQTGEKDWPLLLPMVKSSVRAMDAMQSIVREKWGAPIESFTVSGASKRGWTAWLTAAIDKRVMAVAPMVIDVLNMRAQMDHQRATWGEVSDEIRDYAALDLPTRLKTRARAGVAGDGRSVQLSAAVDAAEDDSAEHERSVLAARCVEAVLVGAAGAEACVVCAESGAWVARCGACDWGSERCASVCGGGEADAEDGVDVCVGAGRGEDPGEGGSRGAQGVGVECAESDEGFPGGEVDGAAVREGG